VLFAGSVPPALDPAAPEPPSSAPQRRPPLGSWGALYTTVLAVAVLTIGLLWWFTAAYNVDLPKAPPK